MDTDFQQRDDTNCTNEHESIWLDGIMRRFGRGHLITNGIFPPIYFCLHLFDRSLGRNSGGKRKKGKKWRQKNEPEMGGCRWRNRPEKDFNR